MSSSGTYRTSSGGDEQRGGADGGGGYRVTSLITSTPLLVPYSRTIPRVLWWSQGGVLFLMSEVPLYIWREAFALPQSVG